MIHMKPNGSAWRHGRARLDLSAKEAAQQLFIAHKYLLNIETNQPTSLPSLRLVYRAAELYGVPYEDLVSDAGESDAPTDRRQDPPTGTSLAEAS